MRDLPERLLTKRLLIRRIQNEDARGWKLLNNAIARRTSWPGVPSITYARNELLHYGDMWEHGAEQVYAVIDRKTGEMVGDIHLKRKGARAEFGWAVHPRLWGKGITKEILDALRTMAKKRNLALWAKVEETNAHSWQSLERHGATFKGARDFMGKKVRVYEL